MARNTFNIFLAKETVVDFNIILTESAADKVDEVTLFQRDINGFADEATLLVFSGFADIPSWLKQLNRHFDLEIAVRTRSASGILVFRTNNRIFAATYGHGWMYLNYEHLVNDFGLRASINALDEDKLNRLERTNLGDALRGSALSPFQRTFSSFGVDDALELVRKIGGHTKDNINGDSMTGSRSLKISGEFDLSDLPALAQDALDLFDSNDYVGTGFAVLDVLRPVTDYAVIEALDNQSVDYIKNLSDNFELGLPGDHVDEGIYYQFTGPGLRGLHPDLRLANYTQALGDQLDIIDRSTLRNHRIIANYDDPARPNQGWSIHDALVGSMPYGTGLYAINEGAWYSVDAAFKQSVSDRYMDLVLDFDLERLPLVQHVSEDQSKIRYESELDYNTRCADHYGYILMDQKLIDIPGVQYSRFEACDLLDITNKRLIHVKKSSRSSSILSHFFKQGANSSKNIKTFQACKDAIRQIIVDDYGHARAVEYDTMLANNDRWSVEFWIIDQPRADGTFNIPFFSKISLKDEVSNIVAMDYEVALRFITQ